MPEAFICDARAHADRPLCRRARQGAHRRSRGAIPIKALMARNPKVDWTQLDEVYFGCANQAGEDNRNVARMALLLAGLPDIGAGHHAQPAVRLGPNAVGAAAQAIRAGEIDFAIAGGVESMTRAPFVHGQGAARRSRAAAEIYDTTIGWRFINPLMKKQYGVDAMPETGENVAEDYQVARTDQDAFALRSQQRAGKALGAGFFAEEIVPVDVPGGKAGPVTVERGRASAARHDARRPRQAEDPFARIPAPSRPATPRASTTAPPP